MADKKDLKPLKIVPYRYSDERRVYSNYIEVIKSGNEFTFKFCDIKPPANEQDVEEAKKKGLIKVPIEVEIVIPVEVAKALLKALEVQLQEKK